MLLYIDPGTGSMLFTILIGILGAAFYGCKKIFIKLKFIFSGGAKEKADESCVPFVIFSDSKIYWNTFEPICDEFEKRQTKVVYMTTSPDDPALGKKYEFVKCQFIGEGNKAFVKLNMLKADILLSTTPGLDVYQWKRSPDVKYYVHVLHMVNDPSSYRMFGLDYYDAVLLSGKYQIKQIRELEEKRHLPKKDVKIVGQPYLDELKKKLLSSPEMQEHETTVLLAPSWGINSIFNRFGDKIFDALLKTGYKIIVRPHPQSYKSEKDLIERLKSKYPDQEKLSWNSDNNNFEVLRNSDIMISDFSGVIFDFSLVFNKPVIYTDTKFDKTPYDACWIDDEMWTFKTLNKIGIKLTEDDLSNIKDVIDDCLSDIGFEKGRASSRKEAWENIGDAAKLTVDYLISKRSELSKTILDEKNTKK